MIKTEYNDSTVLSLTYGKLKELLYNIQEDGIDSDGGSCSLTYDDLDTFLRNEIEVEKSISVADMNEFYSRYEIKGE